MKLFEVAIGSNGHTLILGRRPSADEEGPYIVEITSGISGFRVVNVTAEQLDELAAAFAAERAR